MRDVLAFKREFHGADGLRLAAEADAKRLFDWRNAEHVRAVMRNTQKLEWGGHTQWLARMLASERDVYFIYEQDHWPVGMVCFNQIDPQIASAEWGFYLGETNLPTGTGTAMLRASISLAFTQLGLREITAEVLEHNPRSKHLHLKLGFVEKNGVFALAATPAFLHP